MKISLLVLGYPNMQFSDYEGMLTRQKEKIDFAFGINTNGSIEYSNESYEDHAIIGIMGHEPSFSQCVSLGKLVKEFFKEVPVYMEVAKDINKKNIVYPVKDFPTVMYAMVDKFIQMSQPDEPEDEPDVKLYLESFSDEINEMLKDVIGKPLTEAELKEVQNELVKTIQDGVVSFEYLPDGIVKIVYDKHPLLEEVFKAVDDLRGENSDAVIVDEAAFEEVSEEKPKRKGRPKKNG